MKEAHRCVLAAKTLNAVSCHSFPHAKDTHCWGTKTLNAVRCRIQCRYNVVTFDWRGLLGNASPVFPLSCLDGPPELFVLP